MKRLPNMSLMEPNLITSAMERAAEFWPESDWWGAGDESLALSFGGGVNTTALSLLLLWLGRKVEHIFSDLGLGAEHPRTMAFIEKYSQMVRNKDCRFTIIRPDSIYRIESKRMALLTYIQKHQTTPRMPGPRWCTVSWKIDPIRKYSLAHGGFYCTLLGIGAEERTRALYSVGLAYPLIEAEIDREDCYNIMGAFDICNPGKSGCIFCPRVTNWYIYQLWQEGLVERRIAVEEIPWGGYKDDPKRGQIIPLALGGRLTSEKVKDWEQGKNIPDPNEKLEDLPCACKW